MQVCRQWAGGAADGLRGHRCGAGAGAGLLLAGGAGGRGDLLRWWCAGVVIVRAARSSSGPRGHRAGQECGRRQGWKMGKRKRPGQAARCALLLWPLVCAGVVVLRRVHPGAGGGRWWSVPRFLCRSAAGTGTDPGATVPAGNVPAWHGLRWRCSIRVNFAVCRRGQILHLTGVRSRCRALA